MESNLLFPTAQPVDVSSGEMEEYSVPSYASWFSWNNIHEVERFSFTEFFNATSITRSPRIYKEYRDFIISKYREDPSRKLTFTDVRKSLVGDISLLLKVFTFLEKWGLINFNVKSSGSGGLVVSSASCGIEEEEDDWKGRVRVEEGAPHGVRVVAAPNSIKPIVAPPQLPLAMTMDGGGSVGDNGFRWPPLASYSDVFPERVQQDDTEDILCGSCRENCGAVHYEYVKDENETLLICEKCFNAGKHGEEKSTNDFKLKDQKQVGEWTEAETLILLESISKHGDDWEIAAKNFQEKSKQECILKLVEMPFGDHMLGTAHGSSAYLDVTGGIGNSIEAALGESVKSGEQSSKDHQNEYPNDGSPPLKRMRCEESPVDGRPLMQQITQIFKALGPHVTASAADAAVTALCYENQCSREIFSDDDGSEHRKADPCRDYQKRTAEGDDQLEEEAANQLDVFETSSAKSIIPLNLRTRAATAAALGAAAANAKLLADQEEREIGYLLATMIEDQMKKLQRKMKCLEELESMMETEESQLEELEESLLSQRINLLQRIVATGINEPK